MLSRTKKIKTYLTSVIVKHRIVSVHPWRFRWGDIVAGNSYGVVNSIHGDAVVCSFQLLPLVHGTDTDDHTDIFDCRSCELRVLCIRVSCQLFRMKEVTLLRAFPALLCFSFFIIFREDC